MRNRLVLVTTIAAVTIGRAALAEEQTEPSTPEVYVTVKVLDVDLAATRKLGFQFQGTPGTQVPTSSLFAKLGLMPLPAVANTPDQNVFVLAKNDAAFGLLDALEKHRMVEVVAAPEFHAQLGRTSNFFAGGEFEVPPGAAGGAPTKQRYGTEIDVKAERGKDDQARVSFGVRLSELDKRRGTRVGNREVPAVKHWEMSTTVEAPFGQTVVVCGPTREEMTGGVPAHKMMRLILVTPSLEEPAPAAKKPLVLRTAEAPRAGVIYPNPQ